MKYTFYIHFSICFLFHFCLNFVSLSLLFFTLLYKGMQGVQGEQEYTECTVLYGANRRIQGVLYSCTPHISLYTLYFLYTLYIIVYSLYSCTHRIPFDLCWFLFLGVHGFKRGGDSWMS